MLRYCSQIIICTLVAEGQIIKFAHNLSYENRLNARFIKVMIKSNFGLENFKFICMKINRPVEFVKNILGHKFNITGKLCSILCSYTRWAYFKGSPNVYQAVCPNVYPNHIFHWKLSWSNMNNERLFRMLPCKLTPFVTDIYKKTISNFIAYAAFLHDESLP